MTDYIDYSPDTGFAKGGIERSWLAGTWVRGASADMTAHAEAWRCPHSCFFLGLVLPVVLLSLATERQWGSSRQPSPRVIHVFEELFGAGASVRYSFPRSSIRSEEYSKEVTGFVRVGSCTVGAKLYLNTSGAAAAPQPPGGLEHYFRTRRIGGI